MTSFFFSASVGVSPSLSFLPTLLFNLGTTTRDRFRPAPVPSASPVSTPPPPHVRQVCVCVRRCVVALHLTSTQRNIIADKKPTQKYRKSVSQRFGKKKAAQKSNRKVLKVSVSCVSRGERERSGGGTT
jgi:hypothetical protein